MKNYVWIGLLLLGSMVGFTSCVYTPSKDTMETPRLIRNTWISGIGNRYYLPMLAIWLRCGVWMKSLENWRNILKN